MTRPLSRIYYGWYVVLACNCVATITWGVGIFNQGVFLAYFREAYGWSPVTMSVGATVFQLAAGAVGVFVGRLIDRRGPRAILIGGAAAMAAGAILFGYVDAEWQVFPAFVALSVGFAGLHTVTIGKIVARWFRRHRARAMALATFGAGVGGALLVPMNAWLLERWGGPAGGLALAAISLLVVVPLALFVIKDGPESLGLRPDGDGGHGDIATDTAADARDQREWRVAEATRTVAFWAISASFFAAMLTQSGMLLHHMMFLQNTFGLVGAASVITITTVAGMVGRILFASFGDRFRSRDLATGILLLEATAFVLFAVHPEPWALILGSAIFGFSMGLVVTLQPLTTAECFGERSFGRVFGPIYLWIRIGSALGPLIIGVLYAANGSYTAAWIVLAAMLVFAAIAIRWATPPTPATGSVRSPS
jgi:MFS family permease